MRMLFFFSLLFFFINASYSQLPNGNFENWILVNGKERPVGWTVRSGLPCHFVTKDSNSIEGDYSMRVTEIFDCGDVEIEWVVETVFLPQQIYSFLNAMVRIDSIELGRARIRVMELNGTAFQEIGTWEKNSVTNGNEQVSIPLMQSQTDSLKIQILVKSLAPNKLLIGFAELIIDNLELSMVSEVQRGKLFNEGHFKVSPNPFNQRFFVQYDNPIFNPYELRVIDIGGAIYYQSGLIMDAKAVINFEDLPSGLYILEMHQDGACSYRERIIKI